MQEAAEGDRVGIQHLYSHNKPELYSMSYDNFRTLISFLQQNKGVISHRNTTASEKVDGMALKVGNDEQGFFVQSSYSGKVRSPEGFLTAVKYPPAQQAFMSSFDKLKAIITPITKGKACTIQLEWLYSPNATKSSNRPGMVSFVIANYHQHKLGSWSTFVILDIKSDQLDSSHVAQQLLKINNNETKFLAPHVEKFEDIDLRPELSQAKSVLQQIAKQQIPEQIEALKGNRARAAVAQRKQLESALSQALQPVQKAMYNKIVSNLLRIDGILGDVEGYVIKAGPLMFKVNNPDFMQAKFDV